MQLCYTERLKLWIMGRDGGTEKVCLDTLSLQMSEIDK